MKVNLRAVHKVSRAHLAVQQRPASRQAALEALSVVSAELTAQLQVDVAITGTLRDETVHPISNLSRTAVFALFELSAAGALAILEIDPLVLNQLLVRIAGSAERASGPFQLTRIEQAAMGWLLLSSVSALCKQTLVETHFAPRLIGLAKDRSEVLTAIDCRNRLLTIDLTVVIADSRGQARVLVPTMTVQTALERIPVSSRAELEPEILAASLPARVRVGSARLTTADLVSLTIGDVILCGNAQFTEGQIIAPGRIDTPHFSLIGEVSADGFTFTRSTTPPPQEPAMSETALPVDVEVELTRIRLTIAELANLKPGTVLPLNINGAQPITLCIGDKPIARAELVDVEGELGARIVALF